MNHPTTTNQLEKAPMKNLFLSFARDESAATAIEYGLIASAVALGIIAIVNGLGLNLNNQFTALNTSLK